MLVRARRSSIGENPAGSATSYARFVGAGVSVAEKAVNVDAAKAFDGQRPPKGCSSEDTCVGSKNIPRRCPRFWIPAPGPRFGFFISATDDRSASPVILLMLLLLSNTRPAPPVTIATLSLSAFVLLTLDSLV